MDLYNMIKNVYGKNIQEELVKAISIVKEKLYNLTKERMCKIYNGYLLNELSNHHLPARLINTLDLGLTYEHVFLLIPSENQEYFLVDLTFSQFNSNDDSFQSLLINGYQLVDDLTLNKYISIVTKTSNTFSLDELFYLPLKSKKK